LSTVYIKPVVLTTPSPLPVRSQVVWVDRLTEEGLSEGFGAHTPIVIGQYVSQRYGGKLARGMELFKEEVARAGGFYDVNSNWVPMNDRELADLAAATDLPALYAVTK
jgi:hypothetical protein